MYVVTPKFSLTDRGEVAPSEKMMELTLLQFSHNENV